MRLYEIVPTEEEYDIRKTIMPQSKLVIKYQVDVFDGNSEVFPLHFSHNVDTNAYTLKVSGDGKRIDYVINRSMNAYVEFLGISTNIEAIAKFEVYTSVLKRNFGN